MTLLRDIQNEAARGDTKLSQLLRKCKILSARLRSPELATWLERELNGYPDQEPLPQYRILEGIESCGEFAGSFGSAIHNARIPPSCLPDGIREKISLLHLADGVAVYEELLEHRDRSDLHIDWPADLIAAVATDIYPDSLPSKLAS